MKQGQEGLRPLFSVLKYALGSRRTISVELRVMIDTTVTREVR